MGAERRTGVNASRRPRTPRSRVSPGQTREAAAAKFRLHKRAWALGMTDADVSLPLKPPAEPQTSAELDAVMSWIRAWETAGAQLPEHVHLDWVSRRWRTWGRQQLPVRLRLTTPEAVAAWAGQLREWRRLTHAADMLAQWAQGAVPLPVLRRVLGAAAELNSDDHERLLAVLTWLRENPQSGLFIRELPIVGIDSKWLETHRGIVSPIITSLTGESSLGFRTAEPRIRVRLLGTDRRPHLLAGLRDVEAPASEVAQLPVRPKLVIVTENLASFLALPADGRWGDAVAVFNPGYSASVAARLPWLSGARVLYWGDIDTHGFGILNRFRTHCPHTESVLMDRRTLADFRHLAGTEPAPLRVAPHHLETLTAAERDMVTQLHASGFPRVEQERIEWSAVLTAIDAAAARRFS
ncbi:hypothetical protein CJ198_08840 [Brevibacterium luteolum]|uniref:DUF3322 and DUF2220 domain-containing protein n=1 Tax=Brevibacterium luteolum TaxID=199591 RepID=A0A2N6PGU6_9MICO|nr:hypothetical protein CJ198_08840 [Brevibacterium luteolum]